ncbi:MAG: hypothetical protein HQL45_08470 [Alphaproteobacteria bacterium]|nr:hypothetical protein [Alphaproteobacteria bacterium]
MKKKPLVLNGAVIALQFVAGLPALWALGFPDPLPDGILGWMRTGLLLSAPILIGGLAIWCILQLVTEGISEERRRFASRYPYYGALAWLVCFALGLYTSD